MQTIENFNVDLALHHPTIKYKNKLTSIIMYTNHLEIIYWASQRSKYVFSFAQVLKTTIMIDHLITNSIILKCCSIKPKKKKGTIASAHKTHNHTNPSRKTVCITENSNRKCHMKFMKIGQKTPLGAALTMHALNLPSSPVFEVLKKQKRKS